KRFRHSVIMRHFREITARIVSRFKTTLTVARKESAQLHGPQSLENSLCADARRLSISAIARWVSSRGNPPLHSSIAMDRTEVCLHRNSSFAQRLGPAVSRQAEPARGDSAAGRRWRLPYRFR